MAYALEHPNPHAKWNPDGRYWGYQTRKGAGVSGVVVVHSAEVAPDYVGPDGAAEAVARYFTTSTRAASYHDIVDGDSDVEFLPYSHTAFHDATGTNSHSVGVSMGTQAHTWGTDPKRDDRMLRRCAARIANAFTYVARRRGDDPLSYARWITPTQARARVPGMVEHGQMDPARRSDPWTTHVLRPELRDRLLVYVRQALDADLPPTPPDPGDLTVSDITAITAELAAINGRLDQLDAKVEDDGTSTRRRLGREQLRITGEPAVFYLADGPDGAPVRVRIPDPVVLDWLVRRGFLETMPAELVEVTEPPVVDWLRSLPMIDAGTDPRP